MYGCSMNTNEYAPTYIGYQTTRIKRTYRVPRQMVDPALLPQLGHAGVDEGVAGAGLFPGLE